jgi:hypothetical protein
MMLFGSSKFLDSHRATLPQHSAKRPWWIAMDFALGRIGGQPGLKNGGENNSPLLLIGEFEIAVRHPFTTRGLKIPIQILF